MLSITSPIRASALTKSAADNSFSAPTPKDFAVAISALLKVALTVFVGEINYKDTFPVLGDAAVKDIKRQ